MTHKCSSKLKKTQKVARISTRCSSQLWEKVVQGLNEHQRETIHKMGFGGLLELKCGQMNSNISRKLVERFDTRNRQLLIGEPPTQIIAHDVHSVLGVPIGRKDFDLENNANLVNDLKLFKGKTVPTLINDINQGSSDDSFRRTFILLALATLLCPTSKVVASPKLLQTIDDVSDPCKFNWGKLVLDWLVIEINNYKNKRKKSIGGCLLFLQIFYFHKYPVVSVKVSVGVPIIKNWVKEKMRERIHYEMKQGLLSREEVDPLWLREQLKHEITRNAFKQIMEILKPLDRKLRERTTCKRCSCQISADNEETQDYEDERDQNEDKDEDEGNQKEDEDEGDQNEDENEDEGDQNEDEDEGDKNKDEDEVRSDDLREKKQVEEAVYEDDSDEGEDANQQMEECEAEGVGEDAKRDNDGDEGRNKYQKQVEEEESAKKGEAKVKEKHANGRKRGNVEVKGSRDGDLIIYKRCRKESIANKDLDRGEKSCIEQNSFVCHQCQQSVETRKSVWCTSCKRKGFCESCLHTWYPKSEERGNFQACPLCRGNCNCDACLRSNTIKEKAKTNKDKKVEVEHSLYLLEKLLPCLKELGQEQMSEEKIEAKIQGLENIIIEVSDQYEERVYCNKCNTSIYDYHRSCEQCKFDLCLLCCCELRNGTGADPVESLAAAKPRSRKCSGTSWQAKYPDGRIPCPGTPGKKNNYAPHFLKLKRILPKQNYISELISKAENVTKEFKYLDGKETLNKVCTDDINNTMKASSREDPDDIYRPRTVDEQNDLTRFQRHWRKGHPVIVSNVLECTSGLSWEPDVMSRALLCYKSNDTMKNTSDVKAIDCLRWREVNISIPEFFDGYKKGCMNPMLKLKDWPTFDFLHNILPRHCAEFYSSLPYKEYTHPLAGYLNLAAKWPNESIKPDMGPKLYMAYGSPQKLKHGDSVTTLHCDMSDAVNVMTHVAEVTLGSEDVAVTGSSMQRPMAGAVWDIFRREDVDKLEEYLKKYFKKFKSVKGRPIKQVTHPIHDQIFYLTDEHKKKLKDNYGIEPWTFIQTLGDAVLIPAGCPHQVRNLKPCIKVALDFVSPENVGECIRLTEEFRKLPKSHSSSEDKLQVKTMIIKAVADAVEKLEKHLLV